MKYSQPLVSVGSSSTDATNRKLKIFMGIIPESAKKQNLNLPWTNNYLHSIYIV